MNVWVNFPDWLAEAAIVGGLLSMLSLGIIAGRSLS